MKDNIEKEYILKNSPFQIERILLSSMNNEEIKEFIQELYNEYKTLEDGLEKKYSEILNEYEGLEEIALYTIELILYKFSNDGQRYQKLKYTLEKIEFHLKKEKMNYIGNYKKNIDIHSIPITQVIGSYTRLPGNLRKNILCPIHKEKSPSFRIYLETNSWYCFGGCNTGGNAINFISHIENISTKEAFKIFANLYFKN